MVATLSSLCSLRLLDSGYQARFGAVGGVGLDDTALSGLIDSFLSGRHQRFCFG